MPPKRLLEAHIRTRRWNGKVGIYIVLGSISPDTTCIAALFKDVYRVESTLGEEISNDFVSTTSVVLCIEGGGRRNVSKQNWVVLVLYIFFFFAVYLSNGRYYRFVELPFA